MKAIFENFRKQFNSLEIHEAGDYALGVVLERYNEIDIRLEDGDLNIYLTQDQIDVLDSRTEFEKEIEDYFDEVFENKLLGII